MKKTTLVLLLLGCLLFVCSCKPQDECHCSRIGIDGMTIEQDYPLDRFTTCEELADDLSSLLGKDIDCF
jgi:hypothetical protein